MVGYQADGDILFCVCFIDHMCHLTNLIPDCFHCVNIKNGVHILHYDCKALQTHAGIDILIFKFCIVVVAVTLKLGKDIVPDFHKAVAVAADLAVFLSAAVFLAPVIVDFRTRTTRSCAVLPEIIAIAIFIAVKARDTLRRNTDLLNPDFKSFFVLTVDGRIEPVRVHAKRFCQKFP